LTGDTVKSKQAVERWLSRQSREGGSPESLENTGFLLEFTPYLIRGRNDRRICFGAFSTYWKVCPLGQDFFYYFFSMGENTNFSRREAVYASIAISRLGHKNTTL